MKGFSKLSAVCFLFLAFCGCHKDQADVPVVSSEIAGCYGSLREIAGAKKVWAKESGAASISTPTWEDLKPYLAHGPPRCPGNGTYTIGSTEELPKCSIASHNQYFQTNQPRP